MVLNYVDYVYVSYGISCSARYLEHQKSQELSRRDLVPETKRSLVVATHVSGKCQMVMSIMSTFPTDLASQPDT